MRAAEHGRGQHVAGAVLQAGAAAPAAARPGGEGRHHAVLRARDEAGLLRPRPLGEELADAGGHRRAVGRAHAADRAPLDAVLRRHALLGAGPQLVGRDGRQEAAAPGRHLPLEEVLVPLAHLEARPPALGPVGLRAVGVVGGPALGVDAPQRAGLEAARAALLPRAVTPLTWRQTERGRQRKHKTSAGFSLLTALESVFFFFRCHCLNWSY